MSTLERYIAAINHNDAREVADLFASKCLFNDGGGRILGLEDIVIENREALFDFFSSLFAYSTIAANLVKLNGFSMEYDIHSSAGTLPCIGAMRTDENGLIVEYLVRPR